MALKLINILLSTNNKKVFRISLLFVISAAYKSKVCYTEFNWDMRHKKMCVVSKV